MNIYTFWFGDEIKKNELMQKFDELNQIVAPNHKFILGPSSEEHNYLLKNVEYYKKCLVEKKYVRMADVYRIWKLLKNTGMYMDALIGVNKAKIKQYLNAIESKKKSFILREDKYYVNPCVFYIADEKSQKITEDLWNRYIKYKDIKNINNIEVGPLQFTQSFKNLDLFIFNYDFCENELFQFLPLTFIDKNNLENVFYYSFQGSWKKNKKKNEKTWLKAFKNYYKHKHKSFLVGLYGYLFWKNRFILKLLSFFYSYSLFQKIKSLEVK
ncbi:hypothetical protein [Mycoplasmoides alvi]|uniref:hypothetical protein n=1 Tax=Mycoplasmoides alvi TaxID=78580 RepID=UPI00051ADE99|nr:hypothetical protein [Mycoplasmoides alvi]